MYASCKKSYTGEAVNAENFLAVLTGNASGVTGGSGEVLQSTDKDDVMIVYSDHGANGLVAMPRCVEKGCLTGCLQPVCTHAVQQVSSQVMP